MNAIACYSSRAALVASFVLLWLLSGCASDTVQTPVTTYQQPSLPPVVSYALTLQGAPYHYGSDTPEEGFDCSGFVHHVYQRHGINLPRTAEDMASQLAPVDRNALQAGDLVFFDTNGRAYSHVGLYIDNDQFIHSPSERTGRVLVSNLKNTYWLQHFVGARRPSAY
jgi:cell wall-associated NlpC family hydrolase